jgi:DNA polymerase I
MPRAGPKKSSATAGAIALFDTYSIVFRAFHALPGMLTSGQEPTAALYGACSLVLKILREHRPSAFAFALDAPKRTFRHERFTGYKAHRQAAPDPLRFQLQRLPWLLSAFEVPCWCAEGFEADDVLATLADRLSRAGTPVLIVSGDRDMLQLVNEHVRVWFVGARGKDATLFDRAAVNARFGLEPDRLPAWVALVGDPSDNLVGAPGIGPRTATQLIEKYGSVQGILTALDEVRPDKVRESLREHAERLLMNEELARLRRDAPLGDGPLAAPLTGTAVDRLKAAFQALEFKSLLLRLEALANAPVTRATP